MAGKLKTLKGGDLIPTIIDDSSSGYVELQLSDDVIIPFSKETYSRDGRRDGETTGYIMEVVASEAVTAWCATNADYAACATCATCATCAVCAGTASKAGWTETATCACTAEYWWEALDNDQKSAFVATIKQELISQMNGSVSIVTDERYNVSEHAIQIKKQHPRCLWENDGTASDAFTTISNGVAVAHSS